MHIQPKLTQIKWPKNCEQQNWYQPMCWGYLLRCSLILCILHIYKRKRKCLIRSIFAVCRISGQVSGKSGYLAKPMKLFILSNRQILKNNNNKHVNSLFFVFNTSISTWFTTSFANKTGYQNNMDESSIEAFKKNYFFNNFFYIL